MGVHSIDVSESKAREEKSNEYFAAFDEELEREKDAFSDVPLGDQRMNMRELMEIDQNSKFVQQREQEIGGLVRTIVDLNTIFKDLAGMVAEQVRESYFYVQRRLYLRMHFIYPMLEQNCPEYITGGFPDVTGLKKGLAHILKAPKNKYIFSLSHDILTSKIVNM